MHPLVVVSLVLMALLGYSPESSLGWVTCPPRVAEWPGGVGKGGESRGRIVWEVNVEVGWEHLRDTWMRVLARSELLTVMWLVSALQGQSEQWMPGWVLLLPWVEWLLEGVSVA